MSDRQRFLRNLAPGDEVFWTNPDEVFLSDLDARLCARRMRVVDIVVPDGEPLSESDVVLLRDPDGGEAEALISELS